MRLANEPAIIAEYIMTVKEKKSFSLLRSLSMLTFFFTGSCYLGKESNGVRLCCSNASWNLLG